LTRSRHQAASDIAAAKPVSAPIRTCPDTEYCKIASEAII
jgi:hypothetical protein